MNKLLMKRPGCVSAASACTWSGALLDSTVSLALLQRQGRAMQTLH